MAPPGRQLLWGASLVPGTGPSKEVAHSGGALGGVSLSCAWPPPPEPTVRQHRRQPRDIPSPGGSQCPRPWTAQGHWKALSGGTPTGPAPLPLTLIMYSMRLWECFSITDSIQIKGLTCGGRRRARAWSCLRALQTGSGDQGGLGARPREEAQAEPRLERGAAGPL